MPVSRVGEDEVVVGLVAERGKCASSSAATRSASGTERRRALRLGRAELAAHVVAPHADPPGEPVDVDASAARAARLDAARSWRRSGTAAVDGPSRVVGHGAQQRL